MDISIITNDFNFKVRSVGVILRNNKILLVKIRDNGFFCAPGGHAKVGESAEIACLREIEEEVRVKVKIEKNLSIIENFFKSNGKNTHELTFYFIVSPVNDNELPSHDFIIEDEVDGTLDFKWFDLDNLRNVDFRPDILKEKIISKDFNFEFLTFNQL